MFWLMVYFLCYFDGYVNYLLPKGGYYFLVFGVVPFYCLPGNRVIYCMRLISIR